MAGLAFITRGWPHRARAQAAYNLWAPSVYQLFLALVRDQAGPHAVGGDPGDPCVPALHAMRARCASITPPYHPHPRWPRSQAGSPAVSNFSLRATVPVVPGRVPGDTLPGDISHRTHAAAAANVLIRRPWRPSSGDLSFSAAYPMLARCQT